MLLMSDLPGAGHFLMNHQFLELTLIVSTEQLPDDVMSKTHVTRLIIVKHENKSVVCICE